MNTPALRETLNKPRPALRLVKTNDLPREDWLEVRKQGTLVIVTKGLPVSGLAKIQSNSPCSFACSNTHNALSFNGTDLEPVTDDLIQT